MSHALLGEGWDKEKTRSTLAHIRYIMEKQNLSFLETQVILSWLQCDLNYKLGNLSISNVLDDLAEVGIHPKPHDIMRGYG